MLGHNVTIFSFEEDIDLESPWEWFKNHWTDTLYFNFIYLIIIFGGKFYMKDKPRYDLRCPLIVWNFGLALFSILGASRMLPEFLNALLIENHGFYHSVCVSTLRNNKVVAYWTVLTAWSKLVELGDTVFIVLRKQPLIFLHWYHHISVLVYTWLSYSHAASTNRWFACINLIIHSVMYSYYGFRALGCRIPKHIAMMITISQLLQMVMGFIIAGSAILYIKGGYTCDAPIYVNVLGIAMYTSYLILFAEFFYGAYVVPKQIKARKSE